MEHISIISCKLKRGCPKKYFFLVNNPFSDNKLTLLIKKISLTKLSLLFQLNQTFKSSQSKNVSVTGFLFHHSTKNSRILL